MGFSLVVVSSDHDRAVLPGRPPVVAITCDGRLTRRTGPCDLRMTRVIREADGGRVAQTYAAAMDRLAMMRSARPPRADVVLAGCLVVVVVAEVATVPGIQRWLTGALVGLAAAALAWRRRAPLASFVLAVGLPTISAVLVTPVDSLNSYILVFALGLYSLAAHAAPRRAVGGLLACVIAVWIATFAAEGPGADNLLFGLIVAAGPWLAGWMVRRRTDHAVALALRAQALEQSQAEREQAAVAEERDRIARELHDIIAHSVSVMTIQAGAVEEVLDVDPEKARAAAASIRQTGRQAQTDLRRLLGLLRDERSGSPGLTPQPGLAALEELLDSVRRAGIDVRFTVDGTPRALPPAVDLSAFRVVQEALTNTLKHARASAASVGLRYSADTVDIEVVDDGVTDGAVEANTTTGGHGLVGMRERVTLYGGELEYGHAPTGGWRVHALLPVDGRSG